MSWIRIHKFGFLEMAKVADSSSGSVLACSGVQVMLAAETKDGVIMLAILSFCSILGVGLLVALDPIATLLSGISLVSAGLLFLGAMSLSPPACNSSWLVLGAMHLASITTVALALMLPSPYEELLTVRGVQRDNGVCFTWLAACCLLRATS